MKSLVLIVVGSLLLSGGFYSCFLGYEPGYNYENIRSGKWKHGGSATLAVMEYKQRELNPYYIIPGMTLGVLGIVVVILGSKGFLIKMKSR